MTRKRERLTVADITGAWAIIPTPAKDGASDWRARDTVDLDEAARVAENLIASGIDGNMLSEEYLKGAREAGRLWAELDRKCRNAQPQGAAAA